MAGKINMLTTAISDCPRHCDEMQGERYRYSVILTATASITSVVVLNPNPFADRLVTLHEHLLEL